MPEVKGKKYPYTKAGKKAASAASKKAGIKPKPAMPGYKKSVKK